MADWIDTFLERTEGIGSPHAFRLWSAIAAIAGVLGRRTYTITDREALFPNVFIVLTGEPASGKSVMVNQIRRIWAGVPRLKLGPDNPTKASFLDALAGAAEASVNGSGLTIHCSIVVACRELGVLLPKYDTAFMEDLTDIYDNPPKYSAPRRTSVSVDIEMPNINILAAATPDKLGDLIPEAGWGQGFTSRLMFIYGAKEVVAERNIFAKRHGTETVDLIKRLQTIFTDVHGEFDWEPEAREAMNDWYNAGMEPVPSYGRLRHYVGRRDTHVLKLAMISAISAERDMRVELADFQRALSWLTTAEEKMPDVFRAMAQKSDVQLLDDLHYNILSLYQNQPRDTRRPIAEEAVYQFLESRVPSERVPKIIELAQRTGRLRSGPIPGEWVPETLDKVAKAGA